MPNVQHSQITKLEELKQELYDTWSALYKVNRAICVRSTPNQDKSFKREMKTYRDLRRRSTEEYEAAIQAFDEVYSSLKLEKQSQDLRALLETITGDAVSIEEG